jgi:hypothetical protein
MAFDSFHCNFQNMETDLIIFKKREALNNNSTRNIKGVNNIFHDGFSSYDNLFHFIDNNKNLKNQVYF